MRTPQLKASDEERFLDRVEFSDTCWNWIGRVDVNGYGWFSTTGYTGEYAHRHVFALFDEPLRPGEEGMHICDNRRCVRLHPDHVVRGNQKLNMQDMARKGRWNNQNKTKTHCKRGHELAGRNVYHYSGRGGRLWRGCRQCDRDKARDQRHAAGLKGRRYRVDPLNPRTCRRGHVLTEQTLGTFVRKSGKVENYCKPCWNNRNRKAQ